MASFIIRAFVIVVALAFVTWISSMTGSIATILTIKYLGLI